jgi:pimeloyl-ACP methyl ester carboxylesterase
MNNRKAFLYNGVKIKYRAIGKGNPMVLLHGLGASSCAWDKVSKYLSENNKLYLIDLKGFGLSDKPLDDKYSANDQSEIILDFIEKNNLKDIILVGHSFGGTVALLTCIKSMEEKNNLIKGLILIGSPAYRQKLPQFTKLLKIPVLNELLLVFLPNSICVKMVLRSSFFDYKKITKDIVKNYGNFLDTSGAYHALISTAHQVFPRNVDWIISNYKNIKIPVLLIWGDHDHIIPLSIGQRLSKDIPNSKLVIVPECGHIPQEEKPKETAKIISDFLNSI